MGVYCIGRKAISVLKLIPNTNNSDDCIYKLEPSENNLKNNINEKGEGKK